MSPLISRLKDKIKQYPISTLHISCTIGLSLINTLIPINTPFIAPFMAHPSYLLYALFPFTQTTLNLEKNTQMYPLQQSIPLEYTKSAFSLLYSVLFSATILDAIFFTQSVYGFNLFDSTLKLVSAFILEDAIILGGMRVHPLLFASFYAILNGCFIRSVFLSIGVSFLLNLNSKRSKGSCKAYIIDVANTMTDWIMNMWMSIRNGENEGHSLADSLIEPLFVLFPFI